MNIKFVKIICFIIVCFALCTNNKAQPSKYFTKYNTWLPGSSYYNQNMVKNPNRQNFGNDSLYQWQCVYTNVCCLEDIFFIDSLYGWVTYNNGAGILRTTNSGFNWDTTQLEPGYGWNVYGDWAIDRNTVWVVGDEAMIRKSINGGVNWINMDWPSDTTGPGHWTNEWRSVHFFNQNTGIITGDSAAPNRMVSLIIKTTNAGNTWNYVYKLWDSVNNNPILPYRQYWLNNDTGWVCGAEILLKTTNQGQNFIDYFSKVPPTQNGYNYFNDIFFINDSIGWIGTVGDYKNIYKTINSGLSWTFQDNPVAHYSFPQINGIIFIDENTGWASSYVGLIIETTNSGQNWLVDDTPGVDTWRFSKYQKQKIWLIGGYDEIYYTYLNNPNRIFNKNKKIPEKFELFQNYPNPFNPTTKIKYNVAELGDQKLAVKLIIYDILGKKITTLMNNNQQAGIYEVEWDGSNYPSGVYFYRLTAGNFTAFKKMVLIK